MLARRELIGRKVYLSDIVRLSMADSQVSKHLCFVIQARYTHLYGCGLTLYSFYCSPEYTSIALTTFLFLAQGLYCCSWKITKLKHCIERHSILCVYLSTTMRHTSLQSFTIFFRLVKREHILSLNFDHLKSMTSALSRSVSVIVIQDKSTIYCTV